MFNSSDDKYITEGAVFLPKHNLSGAISEAAETAEQGNVFYNPVQVLNRDLSIIVIRVFSEITVRAAFANFKRSKYKKFVPRRCKGLLLCEPLGASGLRSLRYAKELPSSLVRKLIVNDISVAANEACINNRTLNEVPAELLKTKCLDANYLLYKYLFEKNTMFDIIDLDPYGSVSPYVDSAVQCVANGGLLCLTSTDMQILCGNAPEVAFYKYDGQPVKRPYLHELSLRLLLHRVQMAAAKHRRCIKPLLSLSIDYYIRLFVVIEDNPLQCSAVSSETAIVFSCVNCGWFKLQPFGCVVDKKKNYERNRRRKLNKNANAEKSAAPDLDAAAMDLKINVETATNEPKATFLFSTAKLSTESVNDCCPECGAAISIAGPIYTGTLHDMNFVKSVSEELVKSSSGETKALNINFALKPRMFEFSPELARIEAKDEYLAWVKEAEENLNNEMENFRFTSLSNLVRKKIEGTLNAVLFELPNSPLYYSLASLCSLYKVEPPKYHNFISAFLHLGYEVGIFHRDPISIKTNAPSNVVFDVVRHWASLNSKTESKKTRLSLLQRFDSSITPTLDNLINFELHASLVNYKRPIMFIPNPERLWGPGKKSHKM